MSMKYLKRFAILCGCATNLVAISGCFCSNQETQDMVRYRFVPEAYSHAVQTLLYVVYEHYGKLEGITLQSYNIISNTNIYISLGTHAPFDFAWSPQEDMFVVTYLDGLALFNKSATTPTWTGMAVSCPIACQYSFCTWNKSGKYVAVNCAELGCGPDEHRLGLYDATMEKFIITDVSMDNRPMVWKDAKTLYVTRKNKVAEIEISDAGAKVLRLIPLEEGTSFFYGILNENLLIQTENLVKLGDKTLVQLRHSSRSAVIVTEKYIFVAQSPTNLIIFDHEGHKVCSTATMKGVRFGSLGEDPATVYAVSGSLILRLSVQGESVYIDTICDLSRL